MEMLRDLLALSHVPRWVTHPVGRPQTVADHSYRVACIALAICDYCPDVDAKAVLRWALLHDGPEAKTGDIPSPLKALIGRDKLAEIELQHCAWLDGEIPDDSSDVDIIVGLADTLEAWSWLRIYGPGSTDRFDQTRIEDKLNNRIWKTVESCKKLIGGLENAVTLVVREINLASNDKQW